MIAEIAQRHTRAPLALFLLFNCKYTNISPKNKFLTLNFSLKVLFYLEFNKLYAVNLSFLAKYFVFSQNKSELCLYNYPKSAA